MSSMILMSSGDCMSDSKANVGRFAQAAIFSRLFMWGLLFSIIQSLMVVPGTPISIPSSRILLVVSAFFISCS